MSGLTERFDRLCERLDRAAARSGRKAQDLRLVAVSKTHGAEAVAELARHWAGQRAADPAGRLPGLGRPVFGESYMQEAREKIPAVAALLAGKPGPAPEWHFVGHAQSKKSRDIVGVFELIHSLDSQKLALALQKAWINRVRTMPLGLHEAAPKAQAVLVQVNVGREQQKSGVDPDELEGLLNFTAAMPELQIRGLMCLPPLQEIGEHSRPYFAMLRELRDAMQARCGLNLPELSMGMSDDFEAAIEEGATLVRVGTDIFGRRD